MLALARGSGGRGICCCPPTGCQRVPPSLSPTRPPPPPRVAIFFSLFLSFFLFKLVRADEGKAKAAQNQKLGARDFHPGAASWGRHHQPSRTPATNGDVTGEGRWSRRTVSERAGKAGRFWPFVVEPDPPQNSTPVCVWWWSSQAAISLVSYCTTLLHFFFLGLAPYPTLRKTTIEPRD